MIEPCPDCDAAMVSGDSGEPEHIPGWWCPECQQFWSDDDLEEEWNRKMEWYESELLKDTDDAPEEE